jgi:dTDP-4-amino-4,6-dideoxygalactose transaminase
MSNILAAIGRGQLGLLDQRVAQKRHIFDYYLDKMGDVAGIQFMPEAQNVKSNRWLTVILIKPEVFGANRDEVRLALKAQNVESRPVWKPMHLQPVFNHSAAASRTMGGIERTGPETSIRSRAVGGKVAESLFSNGLCLPSGTALSEQDIDRIVSIILSCRK